ncbi:dCMP deaminase [Staphylococcus aureus]|nr:dCMP deaminase [Staphylococcus aureus]
MNALLQCAKQGVSTDGATIYVTHFPCLNCTKSIIQAGIKTIYYAEDYHNHDYALKLLDQSGIEHTKIPFNQEHVAQYLMNQ